jgi:hypothetical protein
VAITLVVGGGLTLLRGGPSALGPRTARFERQTEDARSPSFSE